MTLSVIQLHNKNWCHQHKTFAKWSIMSCRLLSCDPSEDLWKSLGAMKNNIKF